MKGGKKFALANLDTKWREKQNKIYKEKNSLKNFKAKARPDS